MDQTFNILIYISIYVFVHLICFRLLNFNINKIFIVLLIFFASLFILIYVDSYELLLNLVCFNIFVLSFFILFPGVLNNGPALVILDLLIKNKPMNKKKLKFLFNKNESSRVVHNRLKLNLKMNLIIKSKNQKLLLSMKGKIIVHILLFITNFFKLKTYE